MLCWMQLLGTKVSSGQVTAALQLLLVRPLPLVQVIPAIVIPITGNSNIRLQHVKGISATVSTTTPFGPGSRV